MGPFKHDGRSLIEHSLGPYYERVEGSSIATDDDFANVTRRRLHP